MYVGVCSYIVYTYIVYTSSGVRTLGEVDEDESTIAWVEKLKVVQEEKEKAEKRASSQYLIANPQTVHCTCDIHPFVCIRNTKGTYIVYTHKAANNLVDRVVLWYRHKCWQKWTRSLALGTSFTELYNNKNNRLFVTETSRMALLFASFEHRHIHLTT